MTLTSVSAVVKTNVPRQSIKKDFLSKFTEYLCETYNTESKVWSEKLCNFDRFIENWKFFSGENRFYDTVKNKQHISSFFYSDMPSKLKMLFIYFCSSDVPAFLTNFFL